MNKRKSDNAKNQWADPNSPLRLARIVRAIRQADDAKSPIVIARRFWSKVDSHTTPAGCWPWTSSVDKDGYGQFSFGHGPGQSPRAHRMAWMLVHGPITDGLHVLHECDNPPCCRTYLEDGVIKGCLYLGTEKQNVSDAFERGRRGWNKGFTGRKHTPETRAKMSAALLRHQAKLRNGI